MARRNILEVIIKILAKGSGSRDAKKGLGDVKREAKGAGASLAKLSAIAGAVTTAFVAMKKAVDFAKEGAAIQRFEDSGAKLASSFGANMDAIVESIQQASGGTITALDAMSNANRALILGVATTPEQFENLTKSAIALGRAMGRGPVDAMNDIVTGIGRMSPLILDNLGIMTNGGKVFDDYAISVGKTADELTDAEKKQALLNATMEAAAPLLDKNGDLTADAASEWEVFAARITDTTNEAKKFISDALTPMIEGLNDSAQAHERVNRLIDAGFLSREQLVDIERQVRDGSITATQARLLYNDALRAAEGGLKDLMDMALAAADADRLLAIAAGNVPPAAPPPPPEVKEAYVDQKQAILDLLEAKQLLAEGDSRNPADFGIALNESLNPAALDGVGAKIAGIISGDTFNDQGTIEMLGTIKSNLDDIGTEQPTLDIGLTDDQRQIHDIKATLDALPRNIDIAINYLYTGIGPPTGEHGGSFAFGGFQAAGRRSSGNDATMIGVNPGERVTVEPSGGPGGQSGPLIGTVNITRDIEGQALVESMTRAARRL